MSTYTCSKCGESDLGMYGHHDRETGGFTCDASSLMPRVKWCYDSSDQTFDYCDSEEVKASIATLKKERDEWRGNYRKCMRDMWDTAVAIGVAAGLTAPPDPETASDDYELPPEWCGKSSELIRSIVGERDALKEKLTDTRDALDLCRGFRMALAEDLEFARSENMALKKIERQRWENVNKTFGTSYSTVSDQRQNIPMPNFGTHGPGFF